MKKHGTIIVEIKVSGERGSGKTTILKLIEKVLKDAGYPVSPISAFGDEIPFEKVYVTTQTTRTEWTTKLPQ